MSVVLIICFIKLLESIGNPEGIAVRTRKIKSTAVAENVRELRTQ